MRTLDSTSGRTESVRPPARRLCLRWAVAFLAVGAWIAPLLGQATAESSGDLEFAELSVDQIRAARAAAAADGQMEPEIRARVLAFYNSAIKSLEAVRTFAAEAERFEEAASVSPARIEALQEEVEQPVEAVELSMPESAAQIEERLTQARGELAAARQALRDEDQLSAQRVARRREISTRLGALNQRVVQIGDELRQALVTELRPELREAQQASLLARHREVQAEIAALRAELKRHAARAPTLPLRHERAQRRTLRAERIVELLVETTRVKLLAEMEEQLETVQQSATEAVERFPALAPVAAETVEFAELLSGPEGMRMRAENATEDLSDTRRSIAEIRQAFETSRRKWEAVGFRGVATQWWPPVPIDLERPVHLRREIRLRELQIPEIQHELILLEEKRAASGEVQQYLTEVASDPEDAQLATGLLRQRRALLDELITESTQYSDLLYELDTASRELLAELEALEAFVVARVMWVRSVPGTILPAVRDIAGGFGWLFGVSTWLIVLKTVFIEARHAPLQVLGGILSIFLLFWLRTSAQNRLGRMADRVTDPDAGMMGATYRSIALTALLAAPLPLLLLLSSYLLGLAEEHDLARAAAAGFSACAALSAIMELIARACHPRGLLEAHFSWPANLTAAILWNSRRALVLVLPPVFVSFALREVGMRLYHPPEMQVWSNSLGRVCFVASLVLLSVLAHRALQPSVAMLSRHVPALLRKMWLWLLVSLPLVPAVLAAIGYYVTAALLVSFLVRSVWLVLALALLSGLLHRWETLKLRSLAERTPTGEKRQSDDGSQAYQAEMAEDASDKLTIADTQVRQLFRFGIFLGGLLGVFAIWAPFVPTLRVLDHIEVWPSIQVLTEQEVAAGQAAGTILTASPQPAQSEPVDISPAIGMLPALPAVTTTPAKDTPQSEEAGGLAGVQALMLSDLLTALLIVLATFITAKNIPGLLEFSVLPRLQSDAGVRVAIATLVRYGILIVGLSIASAKLGLAWSKVQWLVAALTFGLAFGLQEIFANFVSGLILLMERPLRVGDVITISTITGTVTRIQMRATTILGWDRSELVVPNKEFVTGQLVNWTLSDQRVRLGIPVGVAYGSTIPQVKAALLDVARANPKVLRDPAPEALFIAFGASTLEFELRVFINFHDGRPKVRDALQAAIDSAFRAQGIVIAFPQMDLHLKTEPDGQQAPTALLPPASPTIPEG